MQYQVRLKAGRDLTEVDRVRGNALCGADGRGMWFDRLQDAKAAAIAAGAFCVIDSENLDAVWVNPQYESRRIGLLRKKLTAALMPKE